MVKMFPGHQLEDLSFHLPVVSQTAIDENKNSFLWSNKSTKGIAFKIKTEKKRGGGNALLLGYCHL